VGGVPDVMKGKDEHEEEPTKRHENGALGLQINHKLEWMDNKKILKL
jgi:hypothetical protein